jgi:hypothetical protein
MAKAQGAQPPSTARWVNNDGTPSLAFFQYMKSVDTLLKALAGGAVGPLTQAISDTTAAAAGVPVNGLYRNGSSVLIRLK